MVGGQPPVAGAASVGDEQLRNLLAQPAGSKYLPNAAVSSKYDPEQICRP
jgi:hypothetical protein